MQAAATQMIKIVFFMLYLLGRDIGQWDLHGKCGSLALFAGYLDDSMMHGYGTSCNGKSKTGSADLSGMGFIHTIKRSNIRSMESSGIPRPESATVT